MMLAALELGLLGVAVAIVAVALRPSAWGPTEPGRPFAARIRDEWEASTPGQRTLGALVLAAAFVLRVYHIRQTMRNDEAYTFLRYASSPLSNALSDYNYPNNHLFHTLLVWLSTRLFGPSPEAIRLPAFLAGFLLVPAVYAVARRFADRDTSLLAMAIATVWPSLILYSTNARGYSLICLLFLVLLLLGEEVVERDTPSLWIAIAVLTAIGMYTAPVMLYPAGAAMLWVLAELARRKGIPAVRAVLPRMIAAGALAGVLTVMGNLPVMLRGGLAPLVSNQYVTALSLEEFVEAVRVFARDLVMSPGLGIPHVLLAVLMLIGLVGVFAPGADRPRRVRLAAICLAWCVTLIIVMRRPPPGRVWLFLVPLLGVYIAIGTSYVVARLARGAERRPLVAAAAVLVTLAFGAHTLVRRTVFRSPESGTLADAPQIADYLLASMRPGDGLAVASPCGPSLDFYMVRRGGRRMSAINATRGRTRVFVVVNPRHLQTLESVKKARHDFPWAELVPEGQPVSFAPETVWVFRYASGG